MIALKADAQRELKTLRKKLYVKYMISLRCEMIAKSELKKLGLRHSISDGAIRFIEDVTPDQLDNLNENLKKSGMELLGEADSLLIDKVVDSINEMIHESVQLPNITYEEIINKKIVLGNEHVLKIFSETMGVSILQYIIIQKIEKAKEFLLYSDLSLPEIAYQLKYKNENFLIAQFKKNTGLSPAYFRDIKLKRERNISTQ